MRVRTLSALLVAGAVAATPTTVGAAAASSATRAADWSTASRTVTRAPAHVPVVTGVRVGHHKRFDRVVVDLRGGAPGFSVRYVRRLHADPSNKVVHLRGPASLLVALDPANAHTPAGASTLTTPRRTAWLQDQVRETAVIGDFEAVVSLGVGLHSKQPFRVLTLHHPTRIVVDVRH